MNSLSVAGFLVGIVSAIPAITMLKHMDKRGKVVNVAFLVCVASLLAAHLGFTVSEAPGMLPALFAARMSGAFAAIPAALFFTRRLEAKESAGETLKTALRQEKQYDITTTALRGYRSGKRLCKRGCQGALPVPAQPDQRHKGIGK